MSNGNVVTILVCRHTGFYRREMRMWIQPEHLEADRFNIEVFAAVETM